MERQPYTQPTDQSVEHEPYTKVTPEKLSELRRDAVRFLRGRGLTKREQREIAIKETDHDVETYKLNNGVTLDRILFANGSFIEMFRKDTTMCRLIFHAIDKTASTSVHSHQTQVPIHSQKTNSANNFIEG